LDPQGEGVVVAIGRVERRGVMAGGATRWKAGAVTVTVDAAEGGSTWSPKDPQQLVMPLHLQPTIMYRNVLR
jgi:hypothetical protein